MNFRFNISQILQISILLVSGFLLVSCGAKTLKIQQDFIPSGSLRLAQVMALADREEIIQIKPIYDAIIASGIPDSEIVDGSVVLARIYCCGGITESASSEVYNSLMLYVPQGLDVNIEDIVEVKSGNSPTKENSGRLNMVIRVVQKADENDGTCWWDPKNDKLWLRILYCDWMPSEGWIKQEGTYPAWLKPVTTRSSRN